MQNDENSVTDTPEAIDEMALNLQELNEIHDEIEQQPVWRTIADKEMDYADGNQLDSELLTRMKLIGIPPAIENMIGPALRAIEGHELETRTDWRVTPNGEPGGQDVSDALNYKLNQAERLSKADKACSDAFRPMIGCGIGWVEVKREADPLKYPYRCVAVNRNEIHWDMKAQEDDLSDARWLRRNRWVHPQRLKIAFPQHKELIETIGRHGALWWQHDSMIDGGNSTGLRNAWGEAQAWSKTERFWFDQTSKEINVSEVWYRRWVELTMLRFEDGRIVEFDENNPAHIYAAANGYAIPERAPVAKMRRSYWMGPHCLYDGPTPYPHENFPYVPFIGFREDNTGIPYGFVRDMKYSQDLINSTQAKLRWGLSSVRVTTTRGASQMTRGQIMQQIARPDAYIELNQQHMAKAGSTFEVERDFELNQHQFKLLEDSRISIERTSSITSGFQGRQGNATSGRQEQLQIDQSNQALRKIMDHFKEARTMVGELLLSMIVEDLGSKEEVVVIEGDAITAERRVHINKPETDPMGYTYLSNDVQRTRIKVILEDVPSTSGFRAQQLAALSEVTKSLPDNIKQAILPYIIALTDTPFKRDIIQSIRDAVDAPTPEQVEQRIKDAVAQALKESGNEIKLQELRLKERKVESDIKLLDAKAVQTGVQSQYSAVQGAVQVAQVPQAAPIADIIMQGAGYQRPKPMGDDPNLPIPGEVAARDIRSPYLEGEGAQIGSEGIAELEVQQNTSPMNPPVPQQPSTGLQGIETARTSDNIG